MVNHVVQETSVDPLFSLWSQSFAMLVPYPRQPPSISPDKMMTGKCIFQVWIFLCVGGIDITLWSAVVTTIDLAFS